MIEENNDNKTNMDTINFCKIQLGLYIIDFIGTIIFGLYKGLTFNFDLDSIIGFILLYFCANLLEIVLFIGIGIMQLVDIIGNRGNGFIIFCFILNILTVIASILTAVVVILV